MTHLVSFALVVGCLYYFDANPRVMLFAFILATMAQVVQVALFWRLAQSPRLRDRLEARTRPPSKAEVEWARNYIHLENAATSLGSMLMLIGGLSLFAFMLSHVDQHQEMSFQLETFLDEIAFALALTLLYIVENLAFCETPMDFDQSEAMNFHFGSRRITVLALAVLFAGSAIAFLQSTGREVTAWTIMGPLVVLKHAFDAAAARGAKT